MWAILNYIQELSNDILRPPECPNTPQKEFTHIGILKTILKQQLETNETGNKTGKSKINSQGYSLSVLRLDLIIIPVGLFALPCSFRSPFVDSTCSLYGRPVRAAIQTTIS